MVFPVHAAVQVGPVGTRHGLLDDLIGYGRKEGLDLLSDFDSQRGSAVGEIISTSGRSASLKPSRLYALWQDSPAAQRRIWQSR